MSAIVLLALMALTLADVVGRYWLNAPIIGSFEVTEMMLAALVFCALPMVGARGEHVSVDLLDSYLPARRLRMRLSEALVGLMLAATSYAVAMKALESYHYGDQSAMLQWPTTPLFALMALMLALSALGSLLKALFDD